MFWTFIIAIGLAWIVQSWLSFQQTKKFTQLFVQLRRMGRVAMGKYRGGITAGAIVMVVLDDDDRVVTGYRLCGVTVLARFKPFEDYNGQFISMIDPGTSAYLGRSLIKALINLKHNYQVVSGGGAPAEPPTALGRLLDRLPGITPKPRVLAAIGANPAAATGKKIVTRRRS